MIVNADHLTRSLLQAQVNSLSLAARRIEREHEDSLIVEAIYRFR